MDQDTQLKLLKKFQGRSWGKKKTASLCPICFKEKGYVAWLKTCAQGRCRYIPMSEQIAKAVKRESMESWLARNRTPIDYPDLLPKRVRDYLESKFRDREIVGMREYREAIIEAHKALKRDSCPEKYLLPLELWARKEIKKKAA